MFKINKKEEKKCIEMKRRRRKVVVMGIGCSCRKIVSPCLFLVFFFLSCQAETEKKELFFFLLSKGEEIRDNQTLVSSGENFVLGFFSPNNSTNRYVGIWFKKVPIQTVVWVANRDHPLTDSSGVLTIESDGNLKIKDGNHGIIWSTNVSKAWRNSHAVLEDKGNLILRATDSSGNSMDLWMSFSHPTDTFLPGMRLGLDLVTGANQLLRSWKNADDPSPGDFSIGLDPYRTAQMIIWDGPRRRWRSGQWNGQSFIGTIYTQPINIYGVKLITDEDEKKMYVTYSMFNLASVIMRFVITGDGKVEHLIWDEREQKWDVFWAQPVGDCEIYGECGPYGICNENGNGPSTLLATNGYGPICSCLRGFEPKSLKEWSGGDWSSRCVRRTKLGCEKNERRPERGGFIKVKGVKLPDFSTWVPVNNFGECKEMCLSNCTCRAYAFVDGIGCLIWNTDLIDIRTISNGGSDLYLRLASSELSKVSEPILIVIITVLLVLWSSCSYLLWSWRANLVDPWKTEKRKEIPILFHPSTKQSIVASRENVLGGEGGRGSNLPLFDFVSIALFTENFSKKLGEGGFGPVYKGLLPGGQEIAVKRLSKSSGQGLEQFKNEVVLMAELQHRNLVKLLGYCIERDERMLIYEYMPNRSLDAFLFDPKKQALLDWTKRLHIIEGIARGLLYLHRDSRLTIIHRDLKASNILLDEEMSPKISDFGMASIFEENQHQAITNRVAGTYGYMSLEYAMEGFFSEKSDVYSFGVLVLEIVSGKKNSSFHYHDEDSMNLAGHAWTVWNQDKAIELIDPSLGNSYSRRQVSKCIHLGLLCVQDRAMDRPAISDVLLMLESDNRILRTPQKPTFSFRHTRDTEPCCNSETYLGNDTTITTLTGR